MRSLSTRTLSSVFTFCPWYPAEPCIFQVSIILVELKDTLFKIRKHKKSYYTKWRDTQWKRNQPLHKKSVPLFVTRELPGNLWEPFRIRVGSNPLYVAFLKLATLRLQGSPSFPLLNMSSPLPRVSISSPACHKAILEKVLCCTRVWQFDGSWGVARAAASFFVFLPSSYNAVLVHDIVLKLLDCGLIFYKSSY